MPVYYLRPNNDSKAGWTEDPAGTAWSALDDDVLQPTAPTTGSDRVTTSTNAAITTQDLTTFTLGANETVVRANLWVYGKAATGCYWSAILFSGVTGKTSAVQTSTSFGWVTSTYAGSLTQSEIDALNVSITSSIAGGLTVEVDAVYVEVETVVAAGVSVTRPEVRLDLTNVITTPSGRRYRWASDDPDPANVPSGGSFSSTVPGGFESREATLPRRSQIDYTDLERLSTWTVYGAGGDVAWEGRLESAPRTSGAQMAASPSAVGWQAHLEDDKSAAMIYRDTDLSSWGAPSSSQLLARMTESPSYQEQGGDREAAADQTNGLPALRLGFSRINATASERPNIEAWYGDNRGAALGEVYYDLARYGLGSADWDLYLYGNDDDATTGSALSADLAGADSAGSITVNSVRYVAWRLRYVGTSTADGNWGVFLRRLAVYGDHGLTKRGTEPDAGFYASDIIKHAVNAFAPLLVATDETVTPSSYAISQAAYRDPTTAAEIIRDANRIHLRDWAVWENRRFYYYEQGGIGKTWRTRIGPSQLSETGPQVDRLYNGVVVSYEDVDGSTRMVAPTGARAGATSDYLLDSDPENPANKLGIRRWEMLSVGLATQAAAIEIGRRFLEQSKQLDHSGSAQLVGVVEDDHGVRYPAWAVRAGDRIVFTDAADPAPRRIIKASYDESSRTCSIDLDAPPQGLDALLERLGAMLTTPLGL